MPNGKKRYSSQQQLVPDDELPAFLETCNGLLSELNVRGTVEAYPCLGTTVLEDTSEHHYLSRLRKFILFVKSTDGLYSESLLPLYGHTPRGTVACSAEAISNCMLSLCGQKGTPLLDLRVSQPYWKEVNPIPPHKFIITLKGPTSIKTQWKGTSALPRWME